MSDIAIRVENLGKMYRIGIEERRPDNLWQAARQLAASPFDYLRRIARPPTEEETLWALRDVSFEVRRGEVVGVIGRNGAGKSTLLKILTRITEPTEGHAELHGRVGSLLEVGTGFHPELTGRENIYLNGAILGMKRVEIDHKFDEIVDFSGIEKFIDTPVKRYSSGMYVRLAFAVAAHLEPEILLVDEVLAVGDVQFQKKCLGKMEEVARQGRTVLFVSHNMDAVSVLCSAVFLLQAGRIVEAGETQSVIDHYLRTVQSQTSVPLSERCDRHGSGCLRFTNILFRDQEGKDVEFARSGDLIEIVAEYEAQNHATLSDVNVSFAFADVRSRFLFLLDNTISGYHFTELPPVGRLVCQVPRLPLSPGVYFFNVYATVNGLMADWVPMAARLEVAGGQFYASGRFPSRGHGGMLVDHCWRLEQI